MNTRRALAELVKTSPEYRAFFRQCCEAGTDCLCAQAWQFREELHARGYEVGAEDLEDALLALARKVLPETPAAKWEPEWGHKLCKSALSHAAALFGELSDEEQDVADLERAEGEWIDRANMAAENNDPAAFRAAVKGWERALVEELEGVRTRPGAA